jgi:hypothetical protein
MSSKATTKRAAAAAAAPYPRIKPVVVDETGVFRKVDPFGRWHFTINEQQHDAILAVTEPLNPLATQPVGYDDFDMEYSLHGRFVKDTEVEEPVPGDVCSIGGHFLSKVVKGAPCTFLRLNRCKITGPVSAPTKKAVTKPTRGKSPKVKPAVPDTQETNEFLTEDE